jgi:hypothetical protein
VLSEVSSLCEGGKYYANIQPSVRLRNTCRTGSRNPALASLESLNTDRPFVFHFPSTEPLWRGGAIICAERSSLSVKSPFPASMSLICCKITDTRYECVDEL